MPIYNYFTGPSERIWKGGAMYQLYRPNCKQFTCQLVLVAAAPVHQDFHPGEKGGGGTRPCPPTPVPTALLYPEWLIGDGLHVARMASTQI